MLTALCLGMIIVFTYLIMSDKMNSFTSLVLIPLIFAIAGGFGSGLDVMMLDGIKSVASSSAFLLFALLFFSVLIDAGMFDPLVKKVLQTVKGDPVKVTIGTAILAIIISFDGDGTTTFMLVISAMLPLYKKLNMNVLSLATILMLSFSVVSSIIPWSGPSTRSIPVLGLNLTEFFIPLIPTLIGGIVWVLLVSYLIGKAERKKVGISDICMDGHECTTTMSDSFIHQRPDLLWVNLALTAVVMVILIADIVKAPILFMVASVVALMLNYPRMKDQKKIFSEHSGDAISVILVIFAGGAFSGILSGTGMADALAQSLVSIIPDAWGGAFSLIVGLVSMPLTFVMSNDAYYFGLVPILAGTASNYGIPPIEIVRAACLAQPTTSCCRWYPLLSC